MKMLSILSKRGLVYAGILACMLVASIGAAAAENESPVMRSSYPGETHKGVCCQTWDAVVSINEPERNVPIIVTFSMDYRANAPFYVGLKLNDGVCAFNGPFVIPAYQPNDGVCAFNGPFVIPAYQPEDWSRTTTTFQWVIMPGDFKLDSGLNTLRVCGGGSTSANDTIELGFYTLSARLQKK